MSGVNVSVNVCLCEFQNDTEQRRSSGRVPGGARLHDNWLCVISDTDEPHRVSRGSGVVWRVSRWVGLVLRLVCEVLVSVSCVSRLPPVSFYR